MKNKLLAYGALVLFTAPLLSGCGSSDALILRVLNMEDYIFLYNEADCPEDYFDFDGYDKKNHGRDLYNMFAKDMSEKYGKKVEVVYTTTATNESLYNELKTGKAQYDVICPSDYMIQKLIYDDLLETIDTSNEGAISNYFYDYDESTHRFPDEAVIKNRLAEITAENSKKKSTEHLGDYAVGYMWGTLGILFNPEFKDFSQEAAETVIDKCQEWSILWDKTFKGTSTIKNSMRDTYAVGTIETFKDELLEAQQSGVYPEPFTTYSEFIQSVMNRCDQEDVNKVLAKLEECKANSFGLEVDSGKQDIVNGKIGINLAWSGDAVYAMEQAADLNKELLYSVPDVGSNIWFDAWVVPKRANRTDEELQLAYDWLNYLSDDETIAKNFWYTGYTPFMAGPTTIDIIRDYYDARTDFIYYYDEENDEYIPVCYENDDGEDTELWYEDFELDPEVSAIRQYDLNPKDLYYIVGEGEEEERVPFLNPYEEEEIPMTTADINVYDLFDEVEGAYAEDIQTVQLEYYFGGEPFDYTFYTSYYQMFRGDDNYAVGSNFYCFLPDTETIERCAVMTFNPEKNDNLIRMWEDFKSDPLPVWGVVILIASFVVLVGLVATYAIAKKARVSIRKARKENN